MPEVPKSSMQPNPFVSLEAEEVETKPASGGPATGLPGGDEEEVDAETARRLKEAHEKWLQERQKGEVGS